ncbi:leucine-rich repeat protein kinase family protein [Striga asiatica]|uniref:Leucine-rich repeat protein kinase family protein n=1 Tax=Striga asiatica TaxID=4170 RepID=A0A5A7QP17_STRAF|nr:leucine-rich repeat protein kinase family protein [Striga asiatica]
MAAVSVCFTTPTLYPALTSLLKCTFNLKVGTLAVRKFRSMWAYIPSTLAAFSASSPKNLYLYPTSIIRSTSGYLFLSSTTCCSNGVYLGFGICEQLVFLEGSRRSWGGSRSLSRNFRWRVGLGRGIKLGVLLGEAGWLSFWGLLWRALSWPVRIRLAGEKETVVAILGGGVEGGFCGCGGPGVASAEGLGAKKREMTCCFCLPMEMWRRREQAAAPVRGGGFRGCLAAHGSSSFAPFAKKSSLSTSDSCTFAFRRQMSALAMKEAREKCDRRKLCRIEFGDMIM